MTFEQHPVCKMSRSANRYTRRFEEKIKPTLSQEQAQETLKITKSILDITRQIYFDLSKENYDFTQFDEISKEFKDEGDSPNWIYQGYTDGQINSLYNEVVRHNTKHQINLNKELYGQKIANHLMCVSVACSILLEDQRDAQEHRRNRKVRFSDEPSPQPSSPAAARQGRISSTSSDNSSPDR